MTFAVVQNDSILLKVRLHGVESVQQGGGDKPVEGIKSQSMDTDRKPDSLSNPTCKPFPSHWGIRWPPATANYVPSTVPAPEILRGQARRPVEAGRCVDRPAVPAVGRSLTFFASQQNYRAPVRRRPTGRRSAPPTPDPPAPLRPCHPGGVEIPTPGWPEPPFPSARVLSGFGVGGQMTTQHFFGDVHSTHEVTLVDAEDSGGAADRVASPRHQL